MYDDVRSGVEKNQSNGEEEIELIRKVNTELEEVNQEVASAQVQDEAQATTTTTLTQNKSILFGCSIQHEMPSTILLLLIVPVSLIPKPTVLSQFLKQLQTSPATTIPPPIPPFIPHSQQSTPIPTPTTTEATTSTPAVQESKTLSAFHLRVSNLEKEVKELKNVDQSSALLATVKSEVLTTVKEYLGTSLDDALHKVLQRHTVEFIKEHSVITDAVEVLKQKQKPQKSDEDIRKIKMEHAAKQQES
ncbi:hypothetical protein Tco_0480730 [Tanacetum coccineum]